MYGLSCNFRTWEVLYQPIILFKDLVQIWLEVHELVHLNISLEMMAAIFDM